MLLRGSLIVVGDRGSDQANEVLLDQLVFVAVRFRLPKFVGDLPIRLLIQLDQLATEQTLFTLYRWLLLVRSLVYFGCVLNLFL